MPNHKTDSNNSGAFSTDFIGMADAYPDADYVAVTKWSRPMSDTCRVCFGRSPTTRAFPHESGVGFQMGPGQ